MQELRFVAVSEDGRYAVLAVPGRSARFTLPIDERLRAVALGQTSRLAQYEIEVESPLRPKEIQARIRAGETVEEIADAAGIAVERVRWFEGPVLAERAYMADQAQSASVRRQGDATPGPRLGEIVTERLKVFGADPEEAQWDAKKLGDGSWLVQLAFISGGRLHTADWNFDPRRRHVLPADDNAARMSLPGTEPPSPFIAASAPGEATVTHLAPRLSTVSGNGGYGNGGRARHERPGGGRPPLPEPHVAEPQVTQPQVAEPQVSQPQVTEPQVSQPQAPEPREPEAPAAATPPPAVPSAPPVSPAAVAAHASGTTPGTQPRRMPQPGRAPQVAQASAPARHAQEARAREEMTAAAPPSDAAGSADAVSPAAAGPAAPVAPPVPVAQFASAPPPPAEAVPSAPAEPAAESGARQGRKGARGKRSSVPSWDEIMFGNSRQRD